MLPVYLCGFLLNFIFIVYSQTVTDVRFLTNSSVFSDGRDGIVILKLESGEETTICNYRFTEIEANIICKSLGYAAKGLSVISQKRYNHGKVLIGDFKCNGNESHIKYCVHSGRKEYEGPCGEHLMDVHVYCLDTKVSTNKLKLPTTCENNSKMSLQTLPGKKNSGFLQINDEKEMHYVCNDDFTFDLKAAKCFCNKMCKNTNYPRPIMFVDRSGFSINENSSYVKTSCSGCSCHSTRVTTCDPSYVVGLKCGDEPIVAEKSPKVTCTHDKMTIIWSNETIPLINSSLIAMFPDCHNSSLYDSPDGDVILSLHLGDCNPIIKDEMDYVLYSYNIQRRYLPVGVTLQNPSNLMAQCRIMKHNQITNKLEFKKATAASLQFNTHVSSIMQIFTDGSFTVPMPQVDNIEFDKPMFVKVYIEKPPKDIKLNLYSCVVSPDNNFNSSRVVYLIDNMCPNQNHDVQISYLSRSSIGFQFRPFNFIEKPTSSIYVKCDLTYCYFPNDKFCGVCKPQSRVRRDASNNARESKIVGPLRIIKD